MGREAEVLAKLDGHCLPAVAHLESDVLHIRAGHRVSVRFSEIKRCFQDDGWLTVEYGVHHRLDLHLGAAAPTWQKAIECPPTLLDKLGARPGMKVAAQGFDSLEFLGEIPRATSWAHGDVFDLVLLYCEDAAGLRGSAKPGARWPRRAVFGSSIREEAKRFPRAKCGLTALATVGWTSRRAGSTKRKPR
jgi:hypothetical protein